MFFRLSQFMANVREWVKCDSFMNANNFLGDEWNWEFVILWLWDERLTLDS